MSPPVIDKSLLPPMMNSRPRYESIARPAPIMQYSPSSPASDYSHPGASEDYNDDYDDNVIVIHEHHHHHHHNDENSTETLESGVGEENPETENLVQNILNDKILYDFVSFLLTEAQENERDEEAVPEKYINNRRDSRGSYNIRQPTLLPATAEYRVNEDEFVEIRILEDDVRQFLEDGFEPIIEVELE